MTNLTVYYQNVRGLRTKLCELLKATSISHYDIICITETWLQPAIHDGEVLDPTYNIYRRDRNQATSGCQRGGGVLIATKRHIQVESIHIKENNIEELFIKIKINNDNLILGCVYIPPHTTYEAYHTHLSAISFLSDSFKNASLLVLGDFNMASSSPRNECTRLLYDSYSTSGCKQCNHVFNEQGKLTRPLLQQHRHNPVWYCCSGS